MSNVDDDYVVQQQQQQHPMIDVADAIQIVLKETSLMLLQRNKQQDNNYIANEKQQRQQSNYETIQLYNKNRNDTNTTYNNSTRQQQQHQQQQNCIITTGSLDSLIGRIVYDDVYIKNPNGYPPYPISIMDGYAINTTQIYKSISRSTTNNDTNLVSSLSQVKQQKWTHKVIRKVFAGDDDDDNDDANDSTIDCSTNQSINDHDVLPYAYYVATGSIIPNNCNCVIPIEDVVVVESNENTHYICIYNDITITKHQWIRLPGSDIKPNTKIISSGLIIDPIIIGLLLQSSITEITVWKQLTIGILSTGNELYDPTNSSTTTTGTCSDVSSSSFQKKGMIPDVNRILLLNLLKSWYNNNSTISVFNIIDLGIVHDNVNDLQQVLYNSIQQCDIIITSAGISRGELDLIETILLQKLNGTSTTIHFGRLNMKPGKPTSFFTIQTQQRNQQQQQQQQQEGSLSTTNTCTKLIFAMPGNPCSALVCTHLLVQPCLDMIYNLYCTNIIKDGTGLSSDTTDSSSTNDNNNNNSIIQRQHQMLNDDYNDHEDNSITNMIQNTVVHPECMAKLMCDVKLDFERPEYHRVVLKRIKSNVNTTTTNQYYYEAYSTGMQRSSRLASMLHATGLLVLPKGTKAKPIAYKGETYLALKLRPTIQISSPSCYNNDNYCCIPVQLSQHMNDCTSKNKGTIANLNEIPSSHSTSTSIVDNAIQVAIVSICSDTSFTTTECTTTTNSATAEASSEYVTIAQKSLSDQFSVCSNVITFNMNRPIHELLPYVEDQLTTLTKSIDVIIVVSPPDSTVLYHATVANYLRQEQQQQHTITKINDTIGQLARRTYSKEDPILALYECIVGLYSDKQSITNTTAVPTAPATAAATSSSMSALQIQPSLVLPKLLLFLPYNGTRFALWRIRDLIRVTLLMSRQ